MTYVEFFDKTSVENIATCLTDVPERLVFIGGDRKTMMRYAENYKKIFKSRGHEVEFILKTTSKNNLENAIRLIEEIVGEYDDCVFDITGGEEILSLALGVVYSRHPHIQIHRFNIQNNVIADCDKDGNTVFKDFPALSVDENIKIYGGDISYGTVDEEETYEWELTSEFLRDVDRIWDICKNNVGRWNLQMSILGSVEENGVCSKDSLTTVVYKDVLERHLRAHGTEYSVMWKIVNDLIKQGLITNFEDNEKTLTVSYKNAQVKRCLTKAGQALEMKIYVTAKGVLGNDGNPVYNDALNGVVIDWDGDFHDEKREKTYDTENEIDVMLMRGVTPVFVSCKNGAVTTEELYKLNSVAERFGGKYAKKVLVATTLGKKGGEALEYFRQRADDMKIKLIENVHMMTEAELAKEVRNFLNP